MTESVSSSSVALRGGIENLMSWAQSFSVDELQLELVEADSAHLDADASNSIPLRCVEVLRLLPGRRVVCRGWLGDAPVVIKWFLGAGSQRYQRRELLGCQALTQTGVPTPTLLRAFDFVSLARASADEDHSGCALVFDYLPGAQDLTDQHLVARPELFKELWRMLARMNEAGVIHQDLHLGNLMCDGESLWIIDGDSVARPQQTPLGVRDSAANFVNLAAQTRESQSFEQLTAHWLDYCDARHHEGHQSGGRPFDSAAVSKASLLRKYRRARRARVLHFQAKTQRNCSAYANRRTVLGDALLDRTWLQARCADHSLEDGSGKLDEAQLGREMLSWLDDLPRLMDGRDDQVGEIVKRGNTATVVAASFRGERLIVKRYNNKSNWHRVRRMFSGDRGLNSWIYAHTLAFTGIAGSEAVALLRTRLGGPTYLVMRQAEGAELDPEQLENTVSSVSPDAFERVSRELLALLGRLAAEGLVHGDTKASNFLWDSESTSLTLIDLDSMRMPAWRRARRRGHERDRRRLLRNFAATPELQRRLGSLMDTTASKTPG